MSAAEIALEDLENAVEIACQAIYAECHGYWPTESERRRIAIALCATLARADGGVEP